MTQQDDILHQRAADRLIAGLGLPDLALGDNDVCAVSFDEHVINLVYDEEHEEFTILATVGEVPPQAEEGYFAGLLAANFSEAAKSVGMLSFDRDHGRIIWTDQLTVQSMTELKFQDALIEAVSHVEFWKKTLADLQLSGTSGDANSAGPWSETSNDGRLRQSDGDGAGVVQRQFSANTRLPYRDDAPPCSVVGVVHPQDLMRDQTILLRG